MGRALPVVVAVVLVIFAVFDLWSTPRHLVKYLPKWSWLIVVVLLPIVGPLLWLFLGQQRMKPPGRGGGGYRRPGPRGPDDDPDYLRGL